jgi:Cft2 family RNA processing exonuclease
LTVVFRWDNGLKLVKADLAIDFRRRQPRAFISHAHTDHMARHAYALCTAETSALYQFRLGPRPTRELPYREPIEWGGLRLTTYPSGHCLGSAMLLAEDGRQRLLYTGDFKLAQPVTAEPAEIPQADILVIESTYGHPDYRLPPRAESVGQLVEEVRNVLEADGTPVIEAYTLGKAQEVTRILTLEGIPVLQHRKVFEITRIYQSFGIEFGQCRAYRGRPEPGHVLVVPPRTRRLDRAGGEVRFAVTGWAKNRATRYRLGVDVAIPLSDHADYDDLMDTVRQVCPRKVYCTHGPDSFVDRLCDAGFDAHPLGRPSQRRLF